MFRAYSKIQGIINHFEDYNQTSQTETGLVFIVDYESYFFSACRHLPHFYFS